MLFEIGEKVHIIERRFFMEDLRRHFVGEIIQCTDHAIRLRGYTCVYDSTQGKFLRKPVQKERVIYLGDRLTISIIPKGVDLEDIEYVNLPEKGLVVTDTEQTFTLDVTEFTSMR